MLHPARLRILQALLGGRRLTAGRLARGVLDVVGERQARGAVERTFALRQENAWLGPDQVATLDDEAQSRAFATFAAGVMAAYDAYLATGPPDLARDGVSYSMNAFWLSDEEHLEFLRDLSVVIAAPPGLTHLLRTEGSKQELGGYKEQARRPVDPRVVDAVRGWLEQNFP